MSGYCFMRLEKVKTSGALKSLYNHNYRVANVRNAIPEFKNENEELVKLLGEDGSEMDYAEKFKERVKDCPPFRKDAVRAYEIVTTFSREKDVDLEEWKKANVKWLKDTFNKAGDGKDNVISVVYHGDETGNVHCHAVVIPIDPRGRLNASYYTNGHAMFVNMQNSYYKEMKQFGLERGQEGSTASHRDIAHWYSSLNNLKGKIPPVEKGESAAQYRQRIMENFDALTIALYGDVDRKKRKMEQQFEKERKLEREAWKKEFASSRETLQEDLKELQEDIAKAESTYNDIVQDIETISVLPEKEIAEKVAYAEYISNKAEILKHDEPEYYEDLKSYIESLDDDTERHIVVDEKNI